MDGIMGWVESLAGEHEALFDWSTNSEEHFNDNVALSIGVLPLFSSSPTSCAGMVYCPDCEGERTAPRAGDNCHLRHPIEVQACVPLTAAGPYQKGPPWHEKDRAEALAYLQIGDMVRRHPTPAYVTMAIYGHCQEVGVPHACTISSASVYEHAPATRSSSISYAQDFISDW